jgi:hypothetical protein
MTGLYAGEWRRDKEGIVEKWGSKTQVVHSTALR